MPFLCCFSRNPFVKRKRGTSQPQDIPAPRMVQLPQQNPAPATIRSAMGTGATASTRSPATTSSTAGTRSPQIGSPSAFQQVNTKLARKDPLRSKALNPNQRKHLPSQAPSAPLATPNTGEQPVYLDKKTMRRMRNLEETTWIDLSTEFSCSTIGPALMGVPTWPPTKKSDRMQDRRPPPQAGREAGFWRGDYVTIGGITHGHGAHFTHRTA